MSASKPETENLEIGQDEMDINPIPIANVIFKKKQNPITSNLRKDKQSYSRAAGSWRQGWLPAPMWCGHCGSSSYFSAPLKISVQGCCPDCPTLVTQLGKLVKKPEFTPEPRKNWQYTFVTIRPSLQTLPQPGVTCLNTYSYRAKCQTGSVELHLFTSNVNVAN